MLQVFVSEIGRAETWTNAGVLPVAASSQINEASRPALTYFPGINIWSYAFRDANNGSIVVGRIGIAPTGAVDGRGISTYVATDLGVVTTPFTSTAPPALSYVDGSLVLAFLDSSGKVSVAMSTTGVAFGPSVLATTPITQAQAPGTTNIATDAGGPYLSHVVSGIALAAAKIDQQGSVDIHVMESAGGVAFTSSIADIENVASALPFPVEPSIAGPVSEMVIAHRRPSAMGTIATVNGGDFLLDTMTNRAVGAASGPGPTVATTLSCADPALTARIGTTDTAVPLGGATTVRTHGSDVALLCGSGAPQMAGCASGTNIVIIKRGTQAGRYALSCWPK
ncbi:MAG: hypothetical protein R3D05_19565 [Dongiaceae bacterium]